MNNIKNFGIKKIAIIIISMILLTGVAYASATIAKERKSSYLPWQGTPDGFYDSAHNVGEDYNPETRFTDNGVSVSDSVTGLEWQKSAGTTEQITCKTYDTEENTASDTACRESTPAYGDDCNQCAAKVYCADLELGGKDDWRLPNIKELRSIVDFDKYNPSIDSIFTNTASAYYWSSTTNKNYTSYAWNVGFSYGYSSHYGKNGNEFVRCLR